MLLQIVPLFILFKVKYGSRTNLLTCIYFFFGLPKIVSPQSFFIISIIFLTISKYFSNLNNGKDLSEEEEE